MLGKFDLSKWGDVYKHDSFDTVIDNLSVNAVHQVECQENPYHILIQNLDSKKNYAIVSFHGAEKRNDKLPPFFCYKGIAENLQVGLVSISDPSLLLNDSLRLSWHLGNRVNGNIVQKIAYFLDDLIDKIGKKLLLCGGSGGGFAALNVQQSMRNSLQTKAIVFNPQTDISKYYDSVLIKYFSSCFYEEKNISKIKEYFKNNNFPFEIELNSNLERLILINGSDPNHVRKHVSKFINLRSEGKTVVCFGDWGLGHVPPERNVHIDILKRIIDGENFNSIRDAVSLNYKPALLYYSHKKSLKKNLKIKFWLINDYLCISNNIFDFFIGHSIQYIIYDKASGKDIFNSGYVTSVDMDGIVINRNSLLGEIRDWVLNLIIEDILGNKEKFSFSLAEKLIKKIPKNKLK